MRTDNQNIRDICCSIIANRGLIAVCILWFKLGSNIYNNLTKTAHAYTKTCFTLLHSNHGAC